MHFFSRFLCFPSSLLLFFSLHHHLIRSYLPLSSLSLLFHFASSLLMPLLPPPPPFPPAVPAVPASSSYSIPLLLLPVSSDVSLLFFCSAFLYLVPCFPIIPFRHWKQFLSYESQTVSLPPLWSLRSVCFPLCSLDAVRTFCSTLMTVLSGRLCTRGLKRWDTNRFSVMSSSKLFLKRDPAPLTTWLVTVVMKKPQEPRLVHF